MLLIRISSSGSSCVRNAAMPGAYADSHKAAAKHVSYSTPNASSTFPGIPLK